MSQAGVARLGDNTWYALMTSGTVGPNLDQTQLTAQQIEDVVSNGRGTGMPAFSDRLDTADITALAVFVRESAEASP